MNKIDARTRRLLQRRRSTVDTAPTLAEVLRGTLRERYVRCGKPNCHCRDGQGHGPVRYLTVSLGTGKTRQITVAPEQYEIVRQYVDNYQRLREVLETISAVNRELIQQRQLPKGRKRVSRKPRAKPGKGRRKDR